MYLASLFFADTAVGDVPCAGDVVAGAVDVVPRAGDVVPRAGDVVPRAGGGRARARGETNSSNDDSGIPVSVLTYNKQKT